MSGKLQKEMHRPKPFESIHQEAFLALMRTADQLMRALDNFLKPHKLSVTQYNVLRILHFAEEGTLPCKKIGERMITRDPDITRLLDRLDARRLISRQRDTKDRRIVAVRITAEGIKLIELLSKAVLDFNFKQLAHIPEPKLVQFIDQLEMVRAAETPNPAPEVKQP